MALTGSYKGFDIAVVANGAITQYMVVSLSTDDSSGNLRVIPATTATVPFGVAQEAIADGASGSVRTLTGGGISLVQADGAFTLGDNLTVADANGQVDTLSADNYCIGIALHGATAANDTMPVLLNLYYHNVP